MSNDRRKWNELSKAGRELLDCTIRSGAQHIHGGHPGFVELQRFGFIIVVPFDREWHAVHTYEGFCAWEEGRE